MAVNKVVFNGQVQIDLTNDTVTADKLLSGYTAHGKDGNSIIGNLDIQVFRVGADVPDSSIGNNGDLFLIV